MEDNNKSCITVVMELLAYIILIILVLYPMISILSDGVRIARECVDDGYVGAVMVIVPDRTYFIDNFGFDYECHGD